MLTTFLASLAFLSISLALHQQDPRPIALGQARPTKKLLSKEWEFNEIKDIRYKLSTNDLFVPVIGGDRRRKSDDTPRMPFLKKREQLFDIGCYPGVEYRIKEIYCQGKQISSLIDIEPNSGVKDEDISFIIRPAYKLIPELERDWPVEVPMTVIPWCLSRGSYNVITVIGSLSLALSFLLLAAAVSTFFTLSVVNTRSMVPNIQPKDVMLVEKVTPPLKRLLKTPVAATDEILFFNAPTSMLKYIEENKLPKIQKGDLIVKRVKSVEKIDFDDISSVENSNNDELCYKMLGDNPIVSLDSRQWGCLSEKDIVGKPVGRVWPINRVGFIRADSLPE